MQYLIIGAGGTGGCLAGYLAKAGKEVTLIARGAHLEAIQANGLTIERLHDTLQTPVEAMTEQEYIRQERKADVIFVCVKGYSLESVYGLLEKASHAKTVIIPILNIYGTGEKIAKVFPDLEVLNGCIYIAGERVRPGVLKLSGDIFRIVYGRTDGDTGNPVFHQIARDLEESGILPILSENVRRDTFQKYSFVSPMAAVGAYCDSNAGDAKRPGEVREMFIACIREIDALANAMGIPFTVDIVETNLKIMDDLADACTASMQKDLARGGETEMDGLIFEVVRMGRQYGVPVPTYEKIAAKFGFAAGEEK
ncbi:MAG: ketopantoate reductase family protein [Eubacteriales bacterium]|nr:ketopantoate reductase family protein [Eubacteriales bacterium]